MHPCRWYCHACIHSSFCILQNTFCSHAMGSRSFSNFLSYYVMPVGEGDLVKNADFRSFDMHIAQLQETPPSITADAPDINLASSPALYGTAEAISSDFPTGTDLSRPAITLPIPTWFISVWLFITSVSTPPEHTTLQRISLSAYI